MARVEKGIKLEDMLGTEEVYLTHLAVLVKLELEMGRSKCDGHPLPLPQGLHGGRDRIAMGNIAEIRLFHNSKFLPGLQVGG